MNESIRLEKAFLERLFKEKQLPMTDFMSEIGRLHQDKGKSYLEALLLSWSVGGYMIQVRAKDSDVLEDCFSRALGAPQDYSLAIDDIEEAENDLAESSNWMPVSKSKKIIEDGLVSLQVQALNPVRVIGDIDEGMLMYERIRAFTQLTAVRLLKHEFDRIENFLHRSWSENGGINELERQYRALEEEHGGFELVDHIQVLSVYAGEGCDRKVFDEMKLPKGLERHQRRGTSEFKLVSRVTPNGMPMLHARAYMEVIAEDGCFKICNLFFRSEI